VIECQESVILCKEHVIELRAGLGLFRIRDRQVEEVGDLQVLAEAREKVLEPLKPTLIVVGGVLAIVLGYSSYVPDIVDFLNNFLL